MQGAIAPQQSGCSGPAQQRLLFALAAYRIHARQRQSLEARRTKMKATCIARVHSIVIVGLAAAALPIVLAFALAAWHRSPHSELAPSANGQLLGAASLNVAGSTLASLAERLLEREQAALADYIAKRYRIAQDAAARFVSIAYRAGERHSVDPLLILAVMAIESRYNPVAESVVGAKGLMQIIPKFHLDKLDDHGGEQALLEPEVNILVGAEILREYTRRFGDPEFALQMYAGAVDEVGSQYAAKVMAEKARLEPVRQKARKESDQSA